MNESISPRKAGFAMPPEWVTHERTWMAWPCRTALWHGTIEGAREAYAAVAKAIARFEKVSMVIDSGAPETEWPALRGLMGSTAYDIEIVRMPLDDSWMRDIGPTFLRDADGLIAAADWRFNAWGGKWPDYEKDAAIAGAVLDRVGARSFKAPFVLEGGSIHVDGEGTILTSEQCLLNPNRNPGLSKEEIEDFLKEWLGGRTVIWMGQGLDNDDTDGHVDNLACFVRPGVVLASSCDDPDDANFAALADNMARLKAARDAHGRALEIIALPIPSAKFGGAGRFACNYVNFYLANGAVIAPKFNHRNDRVAAERLAKAFPDREVVQVPALAILAGGGGIHCITQQQPAGPIASPLE